MPTIEEIRDKCLLALNGVTKSNLVYIRKVGIKNLILEQVPNDTFEEFKNQNKRLFTKRVIDKLMNQNNQKYINMLSVINGISKSTAQVIAQNYTINDLYQTNSETLALLKRSHGQKKIIGQKIASLILEIINC